MKKILIQSILRNQRGATAILVGLCLFSLIGFGALAVDIGHLCVARNELQNAADAGALAGARFLYNNDGTAVNPGANQIARDAAMANMSERVPVEVNWTGGNAGDAQRGHWSFATRTFTPNDSLLPTNLWNVSTAELDADTDFINAVRVTARRQAMPIASYLAGIFGHESFEGAADATAYIGFAGTLPPQCRAYDQQRAGRNN
jgi:Flp pilus assembly protein TadG